MRNVSLTRPIIKQVADYAGETVIAVEATQLEGDISRSRAARIVQEWCDFFAAGPSPILDLEFVSRTPKRLFTSLRGQTQLHRLAMKWGDYDDLGALTGMRDLVYLRLGNASALRDLRPLAALQGLRELEIDGTKRAHDYSPIGAIRDLRRLAVSSSMWGPAIHADSLAWAASLRSLEDLAFQAIIDDGDFAVIRQLDHVKTISIREQKGMRPTFAELLSTSPGMQRVEQDTAAHPVPMFDTDGSKLGEFRYHPDRQFRFHASEPGDDSARGRQPNS